MATRPRKKDELRGKARLRSEIVEAMQGLHKIGVVGDVELEKTTLLALAGTRCQRCRRYRRPRSSTSASRRASAKR